MASTPLYKFLKSRGTSFYAFPGAAEDISAAYQNSNYKMSFTKYVLLNFPKQNLVSGTMSNPVYFDFDNSFQRSSVATPVTNFGDAMIESLRNYVANHETVVRESRLNNTKYYYDTNALETISEKVFFKWCKKLGVIDFEPAIPEAEYFSTLGSFQSRSINDSEYFPEILWKEREVQPYGIVRMEQTSAGDPYLLNKLEVEFYGVTNFKVNDIINIYNVDLSTIETELESYGYNTTDGVNLRVLSVIDATPTEGQKVILDTGIWVNTGYNGGDNFANAELVYNRLVQYIGEINGVSNVQEANRNYTEVHAHVPDHTGRTPDVLFRTKVDKNYRPNLTFPIIPSQYQSEILGAELFNSPIVSNPQSYPGSFYGQFDTLDFTYETSTGDTVRRTGDYYGISGTTDDPTVDGSTIDGITLDFEMEHYVKMNIPGQSSTNFDQFNGQRIDTLPPVDFEFNAILWYYVVTDSNGNSTNNLYGISFLDNPENNPIKEDIGLRFPPYKKLVTNGTQDGTSYSFNLNLNFNIINDNPNLAYNPEAVNSMFSMNLFNDAMKRLASLNDSFTNIISEQSDVRTQITSLRGLLYTQTDINTLNKKITNLENLLRLYSTAQIVSSPSINVTTLPGAPPLIQLDSVDTSYVSVYKYLTSNMYNAQGVVPVTLPVPKNKNFFVNIVNNDEVQLDLPNNDKLTLIVDKDLDLRQTLDINISASEFSSQNKKLDIYMNSNYNGTTVTEVLLIGDIDLPVYYNQSTQLPNSSYLWNDFNFNIDFSKSVKLLTGDRLEVNFEGNTYLLNNSVKVGDTLKLNNFFVGTSSVYDFSGQYVVNSLGGSTYSNVIFDISSNVNLVTYGASASLPMELHSATYSILSNSPYFSLNKGKKISITRISDSNTLKDRYYINVSDIM